MPEGLDALEQWVARLERRMDEHSVIDAEHAAQHGHSGHANLITRVERLEEHEVQHQAMPGHSGHADLLNRISRLEYGIAGTLVGVIFLIVKTFLPGGHA